MSDLKTARRARRELARTAKVARKEAKRAGKKAKATGSEVAETAAEVVATLSRRAAKSKAKAEKKAAKFAKKAKNVKTGGKSRRRRWPWLLLIGGAAAGAVYVARARQSSAEQPSATVTPLEKNRAATNGVAPDAQEREAGSDQGAQHRN